MTEKLAIYYEHPEWFKPLFAEFERRGIPVDHQLAHAHTFDPAKRESDYALVINRMSPSAFIRGHGNAISFTTQYLSYLDDIGANVLHGYETYRYEFSKARQLGLLASLGIRHPQARVVNHIAQIPQAADDLTFPVIVKPNIGGSGAGMVKFETPDELQAAVNVGAIDLGFDQTALVQEFMIARDNHIVRVEVLDGKFLYAVKVQLTGTFNLCPADYCLVPEDGDDAISLPPLFQGYTPPTHVIETVERIARQAHIEVGGVEYLVNDADGKIYYYDINAMSNIVADAPNVVGFDPWPRVVDFMLRRAGLRQEVSV